MKRDWDQIRGKYLQSKISLRELADQTGIPFSTVGKRAMRERWLQQRQRLGLDVETRVVTSALEAAEIKGRQIGLTAAGLVERSILESEKWLDRIEHVATDGKLDADKLGKVVSAWRGVIETGREAFGIGPEGVPRVRINIMSQTTVIDSPSKPAALPPTEPIIDNEQPKDT